MQRVPVQVGTLIASGITNQASLTKAEKLDYTMKEEGREYSIQIRNSWVF